MATSPTLPNRRTRRHPQTAEHEARQRRWASMQQTADYMGVSLRTVREWITQGSIPGYRINARVIRVDLNEVDAAFEKVRGCSVIESEKPAPRQGNRLSPTHTTSSQSTARCRRCNRPLISHVAVQRGCGWRCLQHLRREVAA